MDLLSRWLWLLTERRVGLWELAPGGEENRQGAVLEEQAGQNMTVEREA